MGVLVLPIGLDQILEFWCTDGDQDRTDVSTVMWARGGCDISAIFCLELACSASINPEVDGVHPPSPSAAKGLLNHKQFCSQGSGLVSGQAAAEAGAEADVLQAVESKQPGAALLIDLSTGRKPPPCWPVGAAGRPLPLAGRRMCVVLLAVSGGVPQGSV